MIGDAKLSCEETVLAVRKGHVLGLIVESDPGKTTISVMTRGSIVSYSSNGHVLTPSFDDYTELSMPSVPELYMGWLEDTLASRC